jgi:hypothetical protein
MVEILVDGETARQLKTYSCGLKLSGNDAMWTLDKARIALDPKAPTKVHVQGNLPHASVEVVAPKKR